VYVQLSVERKFPEPYTVTETCKNFCFRLEGNSKISSKQNLQVNSAPLEGCHYSV